MSELPTQPAAPTQLTMYSSIALHLPRGSRPVTPHSTINAQPTFEPSRLFLPLCPLSLYAVSHKSVQSLPVSQTVLI